MSDLILMMSVSVDGYFEGPNEYRIYVHPVVVGQGRRRLFPPDATLHLRLTETRRFGNGVVLLRYRNA